MKTLKEIPDMAYLEKQNEWLYEWKEKLKIRAQKIQMLKESAGKFPSTF